MAVTSLRTAMVTVLNFITNFVANTNNPTGVTAAQVNTYTKTELDNLLAKKMAYSDIPIAYWGQSLDFPLNLSIAAGVLTIGGNVPALLAGVRQVMAVATLPVTMTVGVKNYIYLTVNNGVLGYTASPTVVAESSTIMYLFTTSGTGTSAGLSDWGPVIQIGGRRLSKTRRGNAIPISDASGGLAW